MEERLDVLNTKQILNGKIIENYSKIYYRSNEDLEKLFQNFSVKDKDVYTVLASSDQYLYAKYLGTKSVDSL